MKRRRMDESVDEVKLSAQEAEGFFDEKPTPTPSPHRGRKKEKREPSYKGTLFRNNPQWKGLDVAKVRLGL